MMELALQLAERHDGVAAHTRTASHTPQRSPVRTLEDIAEVLAQVPPFATDELTPSNLVHGQRPRGILKAGPAGLERGRAGCASFAWCVQEQAR